MSSAPPPPSPTSPGSATVPGSPTALGSPTLASAARAVDVSATGMIPVLYRLLLKGQLTKGRLVGLGALAGVALVLAIASRGTLIEREQVEVLVSYGLGLMVPLAALMLATPMIGNLIEDRLLVYLWLKPIPRWYLAVAGVAAVVTVLVPVVVLPLVVSAIVMGLPGLVIPIAFAALLGAIAYGAVYVFFGAQFSVGLWMGIAYLVLWEQTMSRFSDGTAALSIRNYLATIASTGTDARIADATRSTPASIIAPIAVAVVATGLTAWALKRRDID